MNHLLFILCSAFLLLFFFSGKQIQRIPFRLDRECVQFSRSVIIRRNWKYLNRLGFCQGESIEELIYLN